MKLAMAVCAMAMAGSAAAKPLAVGPLGYDRGEWFLRDVEWNATTIGSVPTDSLYRRTKREVVIRAAAFDPSWNMVKVMRRGDGDSDESVVVHPKGTYTYLSIK